MVSRIIMYVCLAGLGITLPWLVVLYCRERRIDPLGTLSSTYRRMPWPVRLFLALYVGTWIAYGSVKAPTNAPPARQSAPRRARMPVAPQPWRVGTGETWDFERPLWATEIEAWRCRVAFADWFACGPLGIVLASGTVIVDGETFDVFESPLSVVPEAMLLTTNGPSCFWYGRAPWGSDVYTWRNAAVNRQTNDVVGVQFERLPNGDRIYRYDNVEGVTSRSYLAPRDPGSDSDGDGIVDEDDPSVMDPDEDGDGLVDGMTAEAYGNHPLWRANTPYGEPVDIRLNDPVVAPAKAVLQVGTLRILLTTNAVYRLSLQEGVRYDVKLTTNGLSPVNLSTGRGED